MYRPRLICVPDVFFEENSDLPLFKRKVVVDQVYECPGFFMYLSNKGGLCPILRVLYSFVDRFECFPLIRSLASEQVTVSFRLGTSASARTDDTSGWSAEGATGICQRAFRADVVYTPLFRLKSLGKKPWGR